MPTPMRVAAGHAALVSGSSPTPRLARSSAVAIGNFDGVHLGHQRLFAEAVTHARALGGESIVLTFDPHPARLLSPRYAPPLIATRERKLELIAEAGIDLCVVEPFDRALASLSPREFIERIVVGALGAGHVCVGYDFTFGKDRGGSGALLRELGAALGFGVSVIEPVSEGGMVCSSTKVREFVLEGRVEGAALLLGRDVEIDGDVVRGAGRGRTIGIPTANLHPATELLPKGGVYAGWAERRTPEGGQRWDAAINIGTNPTFSAPAANGGRAAPVTIEAHLIDFPGEPSGSLYGERLRLGIAARLRDELRFPSVDALIEQIHQDIAAATDGGRARRGGGAPGNIHGTSAVPVSEVP